MDVEKALMFVKEQGKKKQIYIDELQEDVFKVIWKGYTFEPSSKKNPIPVKDYPNLIGRRVREVASKFYPVLEQILETDKKIIKKNFKAIVESEFDKRAQPEESQTNITINSPNKDWETTLELSDANFYGRTEELKTIEQWIVGQNRYRVVAILGEGGIGKTALLLKLERNIRNTFKYVFSRSLINAPKFTDTLRDLIKFLSDQQEVHLPDTLSKQIARVLHYLQQYRCLIMLDNVETILQKGDRAGEYEKGFEEYGQLFKKIGEVKHKSCLIITSRERLKNLERLEGKTKPIRFLQLPGLHWREGKQIFEATEDDIVFTGSDDEWEKIIKFYNGNPLALELVACHIKGIFWGDITAFLQGGEFIFGEPLNEAHDEPVDIRKLLDSLFIRLSDRQKEILYWFAINREPLSSSDLKKDLLSSNSKRKLFSTLQSIQRFIPLKRSQDKIVLQPVLIEYMTERLIEQLCEEITTKTIKLLSSHALMKVTSKEYVKDIQIRLILNPIIENCGKEKLKTQLIKLLTKIKANFPMEQGYVAGNILNLLCQLKTDLTGYDFSHLTIRQADLQGQLLNKVNLTGSHIRDSVFTNIFGTVFSVAFTPDGNWLAAGDISGSLRIWDIRKNQQLFNFKGHTNWVRSICFSPDGKLLASGSEDHTIKIWDTAEFKCLHTLKDHDGFVIAICFSPDGKLLASGSEDYTIKIWDTAEFKCLHTLKDHDGFVLAICFSPDDKLLASGSEDRTIKIWDTAEFKCLHTLNDHGEFARSICFSPDGKLLVSGNEDKTITIWNTVKFNCIHTLTEHRDRVWSVGFSPDGKLLASGSEDQIIKIWDTANFMCLHTLTEHTSWVRSVSFSPNSKLLASGSGDQTIRIWNTAVKEYYRVFQGYTDRVRTVSFSPDGRLFASGGEDKNIRIWDTSNFNCISILQEHLNWVLAVAFSPDGKLLASCSEDKNVKIWDTSNFNCIITLQGHLSWVWSVGFSPDGKLLASCGGDKTIKIWDTTEFKCLYTLTEHCSRVWSVTFSPDGKLLASSGEDHTIKIWDTTEFKCLHTLTEHCGRVWSVTFSPDGKLLASGSEDHTIKIWDTTNYLCLNTFQEHTARVRTVSFSPDGKLLASGSEDHTIKIWDTTNYLCLNTFQEHTARVRTVSFSPDEKLFASGSDDGQINLWTLPFKLRKRNKKIRIPRPYEAMKITNVKGLEENQKEALKILGAVGDNPE
ncbi:MAG: NACHT domain-containing protein [Symploca sp. SIO3C6]|nr:NACHT domain-containing protein [Symploca sp. SIO3C6]